MDSVTLSRYREIIESILTEYTKIPYAYGEIQTEAVFDRERDRYLLMNTGWDLGQRVHWRLVHKEHIVLAFKPLEMRRHTEFATVWHNQVQQFLRISVCSSPISPN